MKSEYFRNEIKDGYLADIDVFENADIFDKLKINTNVLNIMLK